jgi:mannose-1-phosphate guanylyltransferase / phosphomannomutase
LVAGKAVCAPGYDPASRGRGQPVTYYPTGRVVIILEGSFAAHRSIRSMLDLTVFAAVSDTVHRSRFTSFYLWKGLDHNAIGTLWRERVQDEWPAVDAQRDDADFVLTSGAS